MLNISGFYKFTKIEKLKKFKQDLQRFMVKKEVRGILIIAREGINGTISGKKIATNHVKKKF